jgi:pimeloyl-ACP methyl ester carboxylesterase
MGRRPNGPGRVTSADVFRIIGGGTTGREPRAVSTHDVTTTDGVVIRGTVHGQGPPLVFVHGSLGDGDLDWQALLPHLIGEFTCYLPSRRGRGLTADHTDHSLARSIDDIISYVDSIEGPTGLVGWSAGATLTLAAAAQLSDAANAVAVHEPPLGPLMDEQQRAARVSTVSRMAELVETSRLRDAARRWAEFVFHDEETAALEAAGYLEATGHYVPVLLNDIQQATQFGGPDPADPALLARISAPLLVLHGPATKPFFTAAAQHVAGHVPNARIQEISGAGHAAPLTHPEALAEALATFFSQAQEPV